MSSTKFSNRDNLAETKYSNPHLVEANVIWEEQKSDQLLA